MEVLAGFYIIAGLIIIFFASGFFRNFILNPINRGTGNLKRTIKSISFPSYTNLDNVMLQKVPVRTHFNKYKKQE